MPEHDTYRKYFQSGLFGTRTTSAKNPSKARSGNARLMPRKTVDIAQNILVIKTTAGMANAAAAALDHISFQEIVGSLAGDDTIACFCKNEGQAMTLMNKIKKVIHVYE